MDSMTDTTPSTMTWFGRIDNYRRLIGIPNLGYENG
jgi:hypothetical protein